MLTDKREQLEVLCQRLQVRRLDVFGSAVRGDFDNERSDLDFLVEFAPKNFEGAADRFFGLMEGLEELFGRKVDLLDVDGVRNPYFIAEASKHRITLYAA